MQGANRSVEYLRGQESLNPMSADHRTITTDSVATWNPTRIQRLSSDVFGQSFLHEGELVIEFLVYLFLPNV